MEEKIKLEIDLDELKIINQWWLACEELAKEKMACPLGSDFFECNRKLKDKCGKLRVRLEELFLEHDKETRKFIEEKSSESESIYVR